MKISRTLGILSLGFVVSSSVSAAIKYVDLAGPATGGLAIANFKNSTDRAGIEGSGNGLPSYPNFQIPTGYTNAGRYTAVIASPQSTTTDYATLFSNAFYGGAPVTVNNQTVSDSNFSTMSAGLIGFDDDLITGSGTETIPVGALSFNFDTYNWDGYTASGWNTGMAGTAISPFSTVHTAYNAGGGAGNAAGFFNISLANANGTGLTFVDGQLTSMDIAGDLSVLMRIGNFPTFGSATFTGTFAASGLDYQFDVKGTQSVAVFSGINLIMNREGTASVIPEPSSMLLVGLAGCALLRRRHR